MINENKTKNVPADKQEALDIYNVWRMTANPALPHSKALMDCQETIRAALIAPQPVADLEGLKTECHGAASAQCNHAQHPYKWIDASLDHLHATGRLNTAQQVEEIKALKAAVRDLDGIVNHYMNESFCGGKHYAQGKHAATIEAAKEG